MKKTVRETVVYELKTEDDQLMTVQKVAPTIDGKKLEKEILFIIESSENKSRGLTTISIDEGKELIKVLQELTKSTTEEEAPDRKRPLKTIL